MLEDSSVPWGEGPLGAEILPQPPWSPGEKFLKWAWKYYGQYLKISLASSQFRLGRVFLGFIHSLRGGLNPNTEKHLPTMLLHSHHCFSISHSIMPPLCHEAMCTPCASPSGNFGPREPPTGRQRHPMAHARARSRAHPRAHPKMSRQWFAPVRRFCLFIFQKKKRKKRYLRVDPKFHFS